MSETAHQPVASSHDRGHVGPQVRREDATRLYPRTSRACQVPRPFAGHGNRRGPAALQVHQTETGVQPPSVNNSTVRRCASFSRLRSAVPRPRGPAHACALSAQAAACV